MEAMEPTTYIKVELALPFSLKATTSVEIDEDIEEFGVERSPRAPFRTWIRCLVVDAALDSLCCTWCGCHL